MSSEIAALLEQHSYFWVKDEKAEENRPMEFSQAVKASNANSAWKALRAGESVVITKSQREFLAYSQICERCEIYEATEAVEALKREGTNIMYYVLLDSRYIEDDFEPWSLQPHVFYDRIEPSDLGYLGVLGQFGQFGQAVSFTAPNQQHFSFTSLAAGDEFLSAGDEFLSVGDEFLLGSSSSGRKCIGVVHEDTSNWTDGHILPLPQPFTTQQKLITTFALKLYLEENKSEVSLETEFLEVSVPEAEFVKTGHCLGYFPDLIKLSVKPSCNAVAVPGYKTLTTEYRRFDSSVDTELTIGREGCFKIRRERHTAYHNLPERHFVRVVNEGQPESMVIHEWRLDRWKDDRKYQKGFIESVARIPPRLPYDDIAQTGPMLGEGSFQEFKWRVSKEDLSNLLLQVDLSVRMQFMTYTHYGLFSSLKFQPHSWSFSNNYPIKDLKDTSITAEWIWDKMGPY